MEHNEYGASVAPVLVNGDGKVVAQDLENGLDQEAVKAIGEYLEEKEIAKSRRRWKLQTQVYSKKQKEKQLIR